MADKKTPAPAAKKKPTAADLKAAAAQLEEQETGVKKNTLILRIIAFVLWALAAVAMYLPQIKDTDLPFGAVRMLFLGNVTECIIDIVVAGVLCVVAARLWVKANHIHPTKSHSPVIQFIWNQLGVILAGVIFAPLVIILLQKNDKLDAKTKKLVSAVLAVVFLAAAAGSADYHPTTQDKVDEVLAEYAEDGFDIFSDSTVYVTRYGYKHHYYEDCQALKNSNTVQAVTLQEAVEGRHYDVCHYCSKRAGDAALENSAVTDTVQDVLEAVTEEPAA